MADETKGRDVGWHEGDGVVRPIVEVLQERAANRRTYKLAQLEQAYRERAGMIGMLSSCLCAFPLVIVPTPSGHEPWCPSEGLRRSYERVEAQRAELER